MNHYGVSLTHILSHQPPSHTWCCSFLVQTTPSMYHLYFARSFFVRSTIARWFFANENFHSLGLVWFAWWMRFSLLVVHCIPIEFETSSEWQHNSFSSLSLSSVSFVRSRICWRAPSIACVWTSDSLMSSSIHSSVSSSSDVAILPAMTNHLHQNHIESPSKSLKRSRSPSLTRDAPNDNEHLSTTIETPAKRNRKKRTTTDIDQSLGLVSAFDEKRGNLIFVLDDIYLLINFMSIDGPTMNHMPIFMSYKNKFVIISL